MRRAAMLMLCGLLGGCAVSQQAGRMRDAAHRSAGDLLQRQRIFDASLADRAARRAAQDVPLPWVAGKPRPLPRAVSLPAALRENVPTTLMLADAADLPVIAQRLGAATGMPVRVSPEALLPLELFLPRLAENAGLAVPASVRMALRAGSLPLADLLDAVAAHFGVHWRYERNALEFFRTETRVFDLRALSLSSKLDARLGRSGSVEGEGFDHASSTTLAGGERDAVAIVRAQILPFLTRAGIVGEHVEGATSLVVTDTPQALERIAHFLARENKALTRRVRLVFEEITVLTRDSASGGIDWSALYAAAGVAAQAAVHAPPVQGAAALSGAAARGPFADSRAVVSALSTMGAIVRHRKVPMLTLNRRPVTHAMRNTFSYIDQVQSTAVAASAAGGAQAALPAVSISQKEETVGSFITLLPDIQEDGQILLSLAYDNAVAQPLKTITFGERGSQVQVQQIAIDGSGAVQQIELRSGQPVIISGFDQRQDEHERQRLAPGLPLVAGGRDRVSADRLTTLILVTAQVEEGF